MQSKISAKGQVTVPLPIRKALGLEPGDFVEYQIQEGNLVTLRKREPFDVAFHQALESTLDEWATPEDEEAFRDL